MDVRAADKDVYFAKDPKREFVAGSRNGVIYKVSDQIRNYDRDMSGVVSVDGSGVEVLPMAYKVRAGSTARISLNVQFDPPATNAPTSYYTYVSSFYYAGTDSTNGSDYKEALITSSIKTNLIYLH